MIMHVAYTSEMTLTDSMCQEERWERKVASIEDSVEASLKRLENYITIRRGILIAATRNNCDVRRISRTEITRKQEREEKPLYAYFNQQTIHTLHMKTRM